MACRPRAARPAAPAGPLRPGSAARASARRARRGGPVPAPPRRARRCGRGTGARGSRARGLLGPVGEVGRGLPGHQADGHPVGAPGRRDLAEHRDQDPAPVGRGEPGDRQDAPASAAGRTTTATGCAPGRDTSRANQAGRQRRSPTSAVTAPPASPARPGQPAAQPGQRQQSRGQIELTDAGPGTGPPATEAGRAGRARSPARGSGRPGTATTGEANGSGLSTWAICSPVT